MISLSSKFNAFIRSGLVFAIMLVSSYSTGDTVNHYISEVTNNITVKSNGKFYVKNPNLQELFGNIAVDIDTGVAGKVKSYRAWVSVIDQDFKEQSRTKHVNTGSVNTKVPFNINTFGLGNYFTAQCNWHVAHNLRQQGLTDAQIFSEDRVLEIVVTAHLEYDISGPGSSIFSEADPVAKVPLVCEKWAGLNKPSSTGSLEAEEQVIKVLYANQNLTEQYGPNGLCKVVLDGVIMTNHPDATVRYRYESIDGKQSEIKEVTTGEFRSGLLHHEYTIPNGDGPEVGAIRMIGVEPSFESTWSNYSMDCVDDAASGLQANLPPQLHMQVGVKEKVMIGNQLCPSKLIIQGKMTGLGSFSGQVAFVGDNYLSAPEAYSIENGEIKIITAHRDLNWNNPSTGQIGGVQANPNTAELKTKTVKLGMNVTNENNNIIAQLAKKDYTFNCVFPQLKESVTVGVNGGFQQTPGTIVESVPGNVIKSKPQGQKGRNTASNNKAVNKGLPDLKVKGLHVYSNKTKKSLKTLKASEAKQKKGGLCIYEMMYESENKGKSKTGAYQNLLKVNGKKVKTETKKQMLVGQSEKIKLNVALKSGVNKLELKLDSNKQVTESKESNNTKVKKITVQGSCTTNNLKKSKMNRNSNPGTDRKSGLRLKN